jgi:rare lipoprotein A
MKMLFLVLFFIVNQVLAAFLLPIPLCAQKQYKATGKASYYADKFNHRRTTSGELFSNDSLTAAHKTLRFGTLVKVTNLLNDSVVIVRINDRLPKKSSRIIDLSKAAARKLNFIKRGITQVSVEEVIKH